MKLIFLGFFLVGSMIAQVVYANGLCSASLMQVQGYSAHYERELADYALAAQKEWQNEVSFWRSDVRQDPVGGVDKTQILFELGFRIQDEKWIAPSYLDFVQNYIGALRRKGLSTSDSFLPALVLKRPYKGSYEYRFVTPGIDPWSKETDFQIHSANSNFNLPFAVVVQGFRQGRFPLLEAMHDVFHFVGFLSQPSYQQALRKVFAKNEHFHKADNFEKFEKRSFYIFEMLSMVRGERYPAFKQLLSINFSINLSVKNPEGFESFRRHYELASTDFITSQAHKFLREFDKHLIDLGGGVAFTNEKVRDSIGPIEKVPALALDIVTNNLGVAVNNFAYENLSTATSILRSLLELKSLSPSELAKPSMKTNFKPNSITHQKLDAALRLHLARMEYALWFGARMKPEDWVSQLLSQTIDTPAMRFIRFYYGEESSVYQLLTAQVQ